MRSRRRRFSRLALAALLAVGTLALAACPGPPSNTAPAGKVWYPTYSVEFNDLAAFGDYVEPCADWNFGVCNGAFNYGREYYSPGQLQLNTTATPSNVELQATPGVSPYCDPTQPAPPVGNSYPCSYLSGMISSARHHGSEGVSGYAYKFKYGWIEARMKVSGKRGYNSSFWLLPANATNGASIATEIDVFEQRGFQNNRGIMGIHYNNRTAFDSVNASVENNGACPDTVDLSSDYHTYAANWQPTFVDYYIDGVKCGRVTPPGGTGSENMYWIINLHVDPQWDRASGWGLDWFNGSPVSSKIVVDYVRTWQLVPDPNAGANLDVSQQPEGSEVTS